MKVKIGAYKDTGSQDVSVKIDKWDTWSMDHTLAYIVVPMLEQLRDTTHGGPFVPYEERPDHLIGTIIKDQGETDEFHFEAWDWVLGEMLFAFQSKHEDWEHQFCSGEHDRTFVERTDGLIEWVEGPNHTFKIDTEGRNTYQARITNGFRLFGKYYENLWD